MCDVDPSGTSPKADDARTLSPSELRGLQYGVAAAIMPVTGGWRVQYFSIPSFEAEPGTDFSTLEGAVVETAKILAAMNTDEERARACDELRQHMRRTVSEPPAEGPVK
jgi:hypothetical protein